MLKYSTRNAVVFRQYGYALPYLILIQCATINRRGGFVNKKALALAGVASEAK